MKKSLIALAALSAIAGAAQAQSSVEVYGLLDMSYNQVKSEGVATQKLTSTGGTNSGNGTGTLNGSRLGFRGTEDLGNGTKASFVVEYGVNLTAAEDPTTAQAVAGQTMANLRQGFVALTNNTLGTIAAGTQYSFVDATSGALAGAQAHGGTNGTIGAAALFKYGQNARASNAIAYVSPTFAGLTAKIATQQAENVRTDAAPTKTNKADVYALDYVAGNFKAGYAREVIKNATVAANSIALTPVLGTANDNILTAGAVTDSAKLTYNVYGGQYNFGFANVGLNHADYKAQSATATVLESNQNSVSASVPVKGTAWTINAAYTDGKLESATAKLFDTKAYDLIAVYTLSKRTNAYVYTQETKYDLSTAVAVTGGNSKSSKGTQSGIGIRHSF